MICEFLLNALYKTLFPALLLPESYKPPFAARDDNEVHYENANESRTFALEVGASWRIGLGLEPVWWGSHGLPFKECYTNSFTF